MLNKVKLNDWKLIKFVDSRPVSKKTKENSEEDELFRSLNIKLWLIMSKIKPKIAVSNDVENE